MRSSRIFRSLSFGIACLVGSACGDGTGPQDLTVADLLADVDEAQSYGASAMMAGGAGASAVPRSVSGDPAACAFNSGTSTFVCPSTTVNGITVSTSFQLLDASNNPQSSYSRATTAAIRRVADVSGTITSTTGTATTTVTFVAHDDATLSGLLTGTHTLNSSGNATAAITSGGFAYNIVTTQTVTNLVLPQRGGETRYPQSGTIAASIALSSVGITNTTNVTLSFNGSATATLVISNGSFSRTCAIDLSRRNEAPSCS
jgi:hypothetical protein